MCIVSCNSSQAATIGAETKSYDTPGLFVKLDLSKLRLTWATAATAADAAVPYADVGATGVGANLGSQIIQRTRSQSSNQLIGKSHLRILPYIMSSQKKITAEVRQGQCDEEAAFASV